MGKSRHLRLGDVRAAFRLVGECRDLGYDPALWGRHMCERLPGLIGARAVTGGDVRWRRSGSAVEVIRVFDAGLESRERALFAEFMQTRGPLGDPVFAGTRHFTDRLVARTRRQIVTDRDWYGTAYFNEYHRAARIDHCMLSRLELRSDGTNNCLGLHRNLGEPDFPERQRRLMRLFHAELGRLIGPVLVSAADPYSPTRLPPRVRETLACLLDGDSEKQAAARMGLSVPTVHQYVTALYRHYRVTSRAELLARVLRRVPTPDS